MLAEDCKCVLGKLSEFEKFQKFKTGSFPHADSVYVYIYIYVLEKKKDVFSPR